MDIQIPGPEMLPVPTRDTFAKAAIDFENKWDFPNACGSLDGKHIRIKCPKRSGSLCFNYKKFYSKVLFATADANYRFMLVDIGQDGSSSDAGIFDTSPIKKFAENGKDLLPPPKALKNGELLPHVFLGDDAFQLQQHVMRPFPGKFVENGCRVFNYRLSRARLVVENSFGILAARWRILHTCIEAEDDLITLIIQSAVILHNFLMKRNDWNGLTPDTETEGEIVNGCWRKLIPENTPFTSVGAATGSNNYSRSAYEIREKFKEYFNSPAGAVKWQNKHAFKGYY